VSRKRCCQSLESLTVRASSPDETSDRSPVKMRFAFRESPWTGISTSSAHEDDRQLSTLKHIELRRSSVARESVAGRLLFRFRSWIDRHKHSLRPHFSTNHQWACRDDDTSVFILRHDPARLGNGGLDLRCNHGHPHRPFSPAPEAVTVARGFRNTSFILIQTSVAGKQYTNGRVCLS
jgi:hypothetical protein